MNTRADDLPDDLLLDAVARHYAATDPAPAEVLAHAKAIAHVARLDEELAELLDDAASLAGVRAGTAELLRFRASTLTIELRPPSPDAARLVGQVVGAPPGSSPRVVLEARDLAVEASCDEDGFFVIDGAPTGPVRLRVHGPGLPAVRTEWFTL